MILIANRDLSLTKAKFSKKRGWWTPMFLTAGLASAKYFIKHVFTQNTLTQARRNISHHYDLSNELFGLFMDDTMNYSAAIFKVAITFQLCDYRELSDSHKYDRIIACEMIEAVGHEFYETFFSCCEASLAKDGIFVMQFTAIPEELYDESRLTSGFITEYIFPGGCLPSLARVTSAMASSSRLCIENIENIGIHYYQTLRCWRKTFLERQKEIMDLGFDNKFIRTWEYYFDYCAAGFKTLTLRNYQVVFSRPGNVAAFGDPFQSFPSQTKQE